MQIKRYNHKVILEDGTELIPIKTQGSSQLRQEANKRIGQYQFYACHSLGAEFEHGCDGSYIKLPYYLTPENFEKFNNWEDLSAYEALAVGEIKFLGRGGTFDVDALSDDLEYGFVNCPTDRIHSFLKKEEWFFCDNHCYFFSRHKPFFWVKDRLPTMDDADEDGMVAYYDKECYGGWDFLTHLNSGFEAGMPWAKMSNVAHFTADNPAPSPFEQKGGE